MAQQSEEDYATGMTGMVQDVVAQRFFRHSGKLYLVKWEVPVLKLERNQNHVAHCSIEDHTLSPYLLSM